jgi:hypothetical protein
MFSTKVPGVLHGSILSRHHAQLGASICHFLCKAAVGAGRIVIPASVLARHGAARIESEASFDERRPRPIVMPTSGSSKLG